MSIIYGNVKPTFMEIYPDWKYITKTSPKKTVLKAGTPLGANGRIANSSAALGLVVEATGVTDNPISIVVGGVVDYAKVQAGFGNLSAAAISALTGIRLIGSNGSVVVPSPLPSVSSTDNGKVLTVSGGAWTAQQPSGGGGGLVVVFTPDWDSGYPVPDHTITEMVAAATAGQPVIFQWEWNSVQFCAPAIVADASGSTTAYADGTNFDGYNNVQFCRLEYAYGSWNCSYNSIVIDNGGGDVIEG